MFKTTDNMTAGCKKLLTDKGLEELADALSKECHDPIDFAYLQGFIGGCTLPITPKDAETYGMTAHEFAVNGRNNIKDAIIRDALGNPSLGVTIIELGRMVSNPDEPKSEADDQASEAAAEGDAE